MRKRTLALAAAACSLALLLGACGGSGSGKASGDSAVITTFGSEPQNPLVPGNTNETGGGQGR